jgi:hypothetical protein
MVVEVVRITWIAYLKVWKLFSGGRNKIMLRAVLAAKPTYRKMAAAIISLVPCVEHTYTGCA